MNTLVGTGAIRRSLRMFLTGFTVLVAAIGILHGQADAQGVATETTHQKYRTVLLRLAHARLMEQTGKKSDAEYWFEQAGQLAQELFNTGTENSLGTMMSSTAGGAPQPVTDDYGSFYVPHFAASYAYFEAARLSTSEAQKSNLLKLASVFYMGKDSLGASIGVYQKLIQLGTLERYRGRRNLKDSDVAAVRSHLVSLLGALKAEMPGTPGDPASYKRYINVLFIVENPDSPIPAEHLKIKADSGAQLSRMLDKAAERGATADLQKKLIDDIDALLAERINWPRLLDYKIDAAAEAYSVRVDSVIPVGLELKDNASGAVTSIVDAANYSRDPVKGQLPDTDGVLQIKLPQDDPLFQVCDILHPNPDKTQLIAALTAVERWSVVRNLGQAPLLTPEVPAGSFTISQAKPGDKVRVFIPGGKDLVSPTDLAANGAVPAFAIEPDAATAIRIELQRNNKPIGAPYEDRAVCATPLGASYSIAPRRIGPLNLVIVRAHSYGSLSGITVDGVAYPVGSQVAPASSSGSYVVPVLSLSNTPRITVQTKLGSNPVRTADAALDSAPIKLSATELKIAGDLLPKGVNAETGECDLDALQKFYTDLALAGNPDPIGTLLLQKVYDDKRIQITGPASLVRSDKASVDTAIKKLADLQNLAKAVKKQNDFDGLVSELKSQSAVLAEIEKQRAANLAVAEMERQKSLLPATLLSVDARWSTTGIGLVTVKLDHLHKAEDQVTLTLKGKTIEAGQDGSTFQAVVAADPHEIRDLTLSISVKQIRGGKDVSAALTSPLPAGEPGTEAALLQLIAAGKAKTKLNQAAIDGAVPQDNAYLRSVLLQRDLNQIAGDDARLQSLSSQTSAKDAADTIKAAEDRLTDEAARLKPDAQDEPHNRLVAALKTVHDDLLKHLTPLVVKDADGNGATITSFAPALKLTVTDKSGPDRPLATPELGQGGVRHIASPGIYSLTAAVTDAIAASEPDSAKQLIATVEIAKPEAPKPKTSIKLTQLNVDQATLIPDPKSGITDKIVVKTSSLQQDSITKITCVVKSKDTVVNQFDWPIDKNSINIAIKLPALKAGSYTLEAVAHGDDNLFIPSRTMTTDLEVPAPPQNRGMAFVVAIDHYGLTDSFKFMVNGAKDFVNKLVQVGYKPDDIYCIYGTELNGQGHVEVLPEKNADLAKGKDTVTDDMVKELFLRFGDDACVDPSRRASHVILYFAGHGEEATDEPDRLLLPAVDGTRHSIPINIWPQGMFARSEIEGTPGGANPLTVVAFYDACRVAANASPGAKTGKDAPATKSVLGLEKYTDRCAVFQACQRGQVENVDDGTAGVKAGYFTRAVIDGMTDLSAMNDKSLLTTDFLFAKAQSHLKDLLQKNGKEQTLPPPVPAHSSPIQPWFVPSDAVKTAFINPLAPNELRE